MLVPRNTITAKKTEDNFNTDADNQTGVNIIVYRGESNMTRSDVKLSEFQIAGTAPAPLWGVQQYQLHLILTPMAF